MALFGCLTGLSWKKVLEAEYRRVIKTRTEAA